MSTSTFGPNSGVAAGIKVLEFTVSVKDVDLFKVNLVNKEVFNKTAGDRACEADNSLEFGLVKKVVLRRLAVEFTTLFFYY